jgi:hypothetical protein
MKQIIKYRYPVQAIQIYTNEIVYFIYSSDERGRLDKNQFSNLHLSILKSCCCDNLLAAKRAIAEWKEEEEWKGKEGR